MKTEESGNDLEERAKVYQPFRAIEQIQREERDVKQGMKIILMRQSGKLDLA